MGNIKSFVAGLYFGIAALTMTATSADATIIDVNWSGTVTSSWIAGTVDPGDIITGNYSFNSTAVGTYLSGIGVRYDTNYASSFSVNGLSGSRSINEIAVFNDRFPVGDQIDSRSATTGAYTGDLLAGFSVIQINVVFNDSSGTVFSDESLPTSLNIADFDNLIDSSLLLSISYEGTYLSLFSIVRFHVDTFTFGPAASVPEPGTLAIFGLGLAGLGFIRRRRKT